jgi:uroporphyrin-III C-methyltransferase/precorrin-2 dehydrogenase/sirohydrochlorin ferrochelatase
MKHFPIFVALEGRRVLVSGGSDAAVAKLRLLMKTEAKITVFAEHPVAELQDWSKSGLLNLVNRALEPGDVLCATLFYAANDDPAEDARVTKIAQAEGALTNWVDNLAQSQFITPAIVDRDPVTVAIGTEGAAPVLARAIKADLELAARFGKSGADWQSLSQSRRRLADGARPACVLVGLLFQHWTKGA